MVIAEALIISSVGVAWALVSTPGTTHEPILVESDAGFNRSNGVTHGDGTATNPFVIDGWNIDASKGSGIWIENTSAHFVIRDVNVHSAPGTSYDGVRSTYDSGMGIKFVNVSSGTIENSTIIDNWIGLSLSHCSGITVSGNNISESPPLNLREGVMISECTNITLSRNTFYLDGVWLIGSDPEHFNSHSISSDNLVNGNPLIYIKDSVGQVENSGSVGQLIAANCTDLDISNLRIMNADIGIHLAFVRNATVHSCTILESHDSAVMVQYSSDTVVTNCDMSQSGRQGVVVTHCNRFSALNNTLRQNREGSLDLNDTVDSTISGNVFTHDWLGAGLQTSNNNMISDNVFFEMEFGAIGLVWSSNNTVSGNNVTASGTGLSISYSSLDNVVRNNTFAEGKGGITLWKTVNRTMICGNNFVRNEVEVTDGQNGSNHWSAPYPQGGNFWWNESLNDSTNGPMQNLTGADGIGDAPARIAANVTDAYPLVAPVKGYAIKPLASFTFNPEAAGTGDGVTADASGSWSFKDPVTKLESRWDWGNDGTWDTEWSTSLTAGFGPSQQTSAWVRLAVRDANGSVSEALGLAPLDESPPIMSVKLVPVTDSSLYPGEDRPSVSLAWTAFENGSGISRTEVLFDGKHLNEAGLTYEMSAMGYEFEYQGWLSIYNLLGIHTVKIVTYDKAGNVGSVQIRVTASPLNLSAGSLAITIILVSVFSGALFVFAIYRVQRKRSPGTAYTLPSQPEQPGH